MDVRGLLIDIDGVLTVSSEPIDGAVDAFQRLRDSGIPLRLATNTTTRTRDRLAESLRTVGFEVAADEILTAPVATAAYLREHHPGERCFVLSSGDLTDDFHGIDMVDAGSTGALADHPADATADVVVLGGAGLVYTHEQLNHAFRLLLDGAAFVAMHRNLYWRTSAGLELDTGAYAMALEAAVGRSPVVIGKPAPAFFAAGVDALGVAPEECMMIGDDIANDVLGAQACGLHGVLVRTRKFRTDAVAAAPGEPDAIVDSFADVPALVG